MDAAVRAACEACVGRRRVVEDGMAREAAEKLAVILDTSLPEAGLPPTWHWAYFNPAIPKEKIGHDAHEKLGAFLPPAPFDRRMWAAGEVTMARPLRPGEPATRVSTITDIAFKTGSSGALCFVTVEHEITQAGARTILERQTIVYRDRGLAEKPLRDKGDPVPDGYSLHPDWQLFFYSAVTHNGHRIHWDRDFCRDVEGYPGLVVHGPLMATELCDALRDGLSPCRFTFRATAAVFETTPTRLILGDPGQERDGRIERADGVISMKATLTRL
jgi:3-methylfumaryl-CoA hydratase